MAGLDRSRLVGMSGMVAGIAATGILLIESMDVMTPGGGYIRRSVQSIAED